MEFSQHFLSRRLKYIKSYNIKCHIFHSGLQRIRLLNIKNFTIELRTNFFKQIILFFIYSNFYDNISREEYNALRIYDKYIRTKFVQKISLDNYNVTIKAKSYIGLLKISPVLQIIIKPKIEADFIAMLKYIDDKKILIWQKLVESIKKEENFIEFFIKSFSEEIN